MNVKSSGNLLGDEIVVQLDPDQLSPDVLALNADLFAASNRQRKQGDHEHEMQSALFAWIRLQRTQYPGLQMAFAVPNGGLRHPATAARMKREGVEPGVPDVILLHPSADGRYHGGCWELKVGGNRSTDAQIVWQGRLLAAGYYVVTIHNDWQLVARDMMIYLGYSVDRECF